MSEDFTKLLYVNFEGGDLIAYANHFGGLRLISEAIFIMSRISSISTLLKPILSSGSRDGINIRIGSTNSRRASNNGASTGELFSCIVLYQSMLFSKFKVYVRKISLLSANSKATCGLGRSRNSLMMPLYSSTVTTRVHFSGFNLSVLLTKEPINSRRGSGPLAAAAAASALNTQYFGSNRKKFLQFLRNLMKM
uniref:Uncharacterized protein n=1 Tax=Glossina pallidipes TaxID=7398 RepID=A0A1A9ZDH6_GLOPL